MRIPQIIQDLPDAGCRLHRPKTKLQARARKKPLLLAASPQLSVLKAREAVAIQGGCIQIGRTFRALQNPRRGLELTERRPRKPWRLAALPLLGALVCYALRLIGLALQSSGCHIESGGRKKAAKALSVMSPGHSWMAENQKIQL